MLEKNGQIGDVIKHLKQVLFRWRLKIFKSLQ